MSAAIVVTFSMRSLRPVSGWSNFHFGTLMPLDREASPFHCLAALFRRRLIAGKTGGVHHHLRGSWEPMYDPARRRCSDRRYATGVTKYPAEVRPYSQLPMRRNALQ